MSPRSEETSPTPPMPGRLEIVATATLGDIGGRFDILNYIELLRRLGQVLCLRIRRRRYGSTQYHIRDSWLKAVLCRLGLPREVHEFEIMEIRAGAEWRKRPDDDELPALWTGSVSRERFGLPDLSRLDSVHQVTWGPGAEELECGEASQQSQYLLIAHPWGPDAVQLVEIPDRVVQADVMPSTPPAPSVYCYLCERLIRASEFSKTLCVFHPGDIVDAESSESGSNSSFDTDNSSDGQVWTCCGAAFVIANKGCIVERQHLNYEEARPLVENGRTWRLTRDIFEVLESESESGSN